MPLLAFRVVCGMTIFVGTYVAAQLGGARHAGWVAASVGSIMALVVALKVSAPPDSFLLLTKPLPSSAQPRLRVLLPAAGLLFLLVLTPLLITKVPPDDDYPNHLARLYVMVHGRADPFLNQFYAIRWSVIPNLGMEIVLPFFSSHTTIFISGRAFLIASALLLMAGPHAIHYALYRKLSFGPLVAALFVYNYDGKIGFVNYLAGIGFALFAIASWIALRQTSPLTRGAVSLGCAIALFFCHFEALGIYGLAIGSFQLWLLWSRPGTPREQLTDAVVLLLPFAVVLPLLLLGPRDEAPSIPSQWGGIHVRLDGIRFLVETYFPRLDLLAMAVMAATFVWAVLYRILRFHPFGWVFIAVATVAYFVIPNRTMGSWGAADRLPIAVLLVLIGVLYLGSIIGQRSAILPCCGHDPCAVQDGDGRGRVLAVRQDQDRI